MHRNLQRGFAILLFFKGFRGVVRLPSGVMVGLLRGLISIAEVWHIDASAFPILCCPHRVERTVFGGKHFLILFSRAEINRKSVRWAARNLRIEADKNIAPIAQSGSGHTMVPC